MSKENNKRLKALKALKIGENVENEGKKLHLSDDENEVAKTTSTGSVAPVCKLSHRERGYFNALVEFLDSRGLLETVDTLLLTMLAKNVSLWREISERIKGVDDLVQVFENGTSNVSGLQTAKDKSEAAILRLSAKLGLSPLDRAKLFGAASSTELAKTKSNDGDDLDNFLN
jgi:phage terminase small subunit